MLQLVQILVIVCDIITTTTAFTFSYFIYFWFIDNVFGSASISQCAQCLSITVLAGRHG